MLSGNIIRKICRENTWHSLSGDSFTIIFVEILPPATGGRLVDSSPRQRRGRKQDGERRTVDVYIYRKVDEANGRGGEEEKEGVIRMVRKRWRGVAPYFYTVWPLLCIIPHLARSSRDAAPARAMQISSPRWKPPEPTERFAVPTNDGRRRGRERNGIAEGLTPAVPFLEEGKRKEEEQEEDVFWYDERITRWSFLLRT